MHGILEDILKLMSSSGENFFYFDINVLYQYALRMSLLCQ